MMKIATMNDKKGKLLAGSRWVRLGEVCTFKNGINFTADQKGVGIPTVDVFNMYSDSLQILTNDLYRVDIKLSDEYFLKADDILIVRSSVKREGVGWPSLFAGHEEPVTFCGFIIRARLISNQLSPQFMIHYLRQAHVRAMVVGKSGTGTITNISQSNLKQLMIPCPPLSEQKRIAELLGEQMAAVKKARVAAKARLEATLALPAALVRETLRTGPMHRRLLGDCLAEVRNGVGADWSKYTVLGATRNGIAPAKESVGKTPARYKLVDPVTVFYNPMRILLGSIAMVDVANATGITSPDYVVVKGRPGILDTRWFYYWFRSTYGVQLIESLSRGAVRERILFNRLAAGLIQLPDYEIQLRVSEQMKQLRPIAENITEELRAIDAMPSAIQREVFAGGAR